MESAPERPRRRLTLLFVRYGIGGIMVLGGLVLLIAVPGTGVDGFAMAAGGGLSVLMINFLFRMGVQGDREREQEEAARRYLDEHGHWPDEPEPPAPTVRAPGSRSSR